ncbi:uncharacterized protein LOC101895205 [Musca domestica]|uniref:Uncharacterized protein LOC101895205 n=1 Tax=Musca domestica TaxID=7370 RepID=A0A1I8MUG2_MUSDO|nr:uncharacterized protein LOC101895205 [Musca domestica]
MLMKWIRILMRLLMVASVIFILLPAAVQCGPVPKVNEHEMLMPKVPQWHCLRYFKHDVLMMRRCRHLRVPTAPRLGDVKKLSQSLNYNFVKTSDNNKAPATNSKNS